MRRIIATALMLAALAGFAPDTIAGGADRDCAAFATQQEAQAWFAAHGGSTTDDIDRLDADHDGIACEHLPGAAGAGADANAGSPWLWAGLGAMGIGAAGIGGVAAVRRSRKARPNGPGMLVGAMAPSLPELPGALPCDPPPPGWPAVTPARAQELAAMPDADYRRTPEWTQRAEAVLGVTGGRCQLCSADLMLPEDVRHRTQARRGNELPCDLIVLCDACAAQLDASS